MIIDKETYGQILDGVREIPPEMGGILGSKNGVVCTFEIDYGDNRHVCSYSPNVNRLNGIIAEWQNAGIKFKGIFHTHFWGVDTLSDGDKDYMYKILKNMPISVKVLYFPLIVLPEKRMVVYQSQICDEQLCVKKDCIESHSGGTNL